MIIVSIQQHHNSDIYYINYQKPLEKVFSHLTHYTCTQIKINKQKIYLSYFALWHQIAHIQNSMKNAVYQTLLMTQHVKSTVSQKPLWFDKLTCISIIFNNIIVKGHGSFIVCFSTLYFIIHHLYGWIVGKLQISFSQKKKNWIISLQILDDTSWVLQTIAP